jgi:hypothetical protein
MDVYRPIYTHSSVFGLNVVLEFIHGREHLRVETKSWIDLGVNLCRYKKKFFLRDLKNSIEASDLTCASIGSRMSLNSLLGSV